MTAPERTWLYVDTDDDGERYMELIHEHAHVQTDVEYIRADIHAAHIAALTAKLAEREAQVARLLEMQTEAEVDHERQLAEARALVRRSYDAHGEDLLEHKFNRLMLDMEKFMKGTP